MFEEWKEGFSKLLSKPTTKVEGGISLKKVEEGWCVDANYPTTKLFGPATKLEKGKGAQVGEIREWNGQKYKKDASGKWVLASEGRQKKQDQETAPKESGVTEEKKPSVSELSDEQLSQYARSAKTESLKRHSESGDEKMRLVAKAELARRESEENPANKQQGEASGQEEGKTVQNTQENKEKGSETTIEGKVEKLNQDYRKTVEQLMDPEIFTKSQDEYTNLSNKQREVARYIDRVKEFEGVDQEQAKTETLKKLGLTTDTELQEFLGDGKVLSVKKSFGLLSFLTEDCYLQITPSLNDKNLHLDEILLDVDQEKGKGKGTEIFSNQVKQLQSQGYKAIELTAAKSSIYNGYYTWAILGFEIDKNWNPSSKGIDDFKELVKTSDSEKIRKCKKLSELMSFKEGAEFWKKNGFQFEGKFDLKENSNSMKLLNSYIESRNKKRS